MKRFLIFLFLLISNFSFSKEVKGYIRFLNSKADFIAGLKLEYNY